MNTCVIARYKFISNKFVVYRETSCAKEKNLRKEKVLLESKLEANSSTCSAARAPPWIILNIILNNKHLINLFGQFSCIHCYREGNQATKWADIQDALRWNNALSTIIFQQRLE